jgi:hypothetical protein
VEVFTTRFVETLVGVRAEVVTLRLQQIGGQEFTAIPIEKGKRAGHGWSWDTLTDSFLYNPSPCILRGKHLLLEVWIEQQVRQFGIVVEGFFDLA